MSPWPVTKITGILAFRSCQFLLEIKSAEPGQADVQDQATHLVRKLCSQELRGRAISLTPQTDRLEKALQALSDVKIVVNNVDDRVVICPILHG